MRRGQAGANPHQPESADESRECRASRARWRVRVEGDQAASGGLQCGRRPIVRKVGCQVGHNLNTDAVHR
jgi:hypothetical protein